MLASGPDLDAGRRDKHEEIRVEMEVNHILLPRAGLESSQDSRPTKREIHIGEGGTQERALHSPIRLDAPGPLCIMTLNSGGGRKLLLWRRSTSSAMCPLITRTSNL